MLAGVVSAQTIQHQLKQPWQWLKADKPHFFCVSPACQVIYFDATGEVIEGHALRQAVGIKSTDDSALICYCFDVSRADAKANPDAKAYVMAQTKQKLCACRIRNPSGQCCLKDFAMLEGVS